MSLTPDQRETYGYPQPGEPGPAPAPQMVSVKMPSATPFVTYAILGITILVFIAQLATEALTGVDIPAALGMKVNDLILEGQYWRLLTPMLLHGSILHVAFNMYALVNLGPSLERFFGHGRFLALYLLAGFAGNVVSFAFTPNPSLGSSTAIFGLIAAEGVFLLKNRTLFGRRAQAALTQVVLIAVVNLFLGLQAGIDNWGHVGGLVGGFIYSWIAAPVLSVGGIAPNLRFEDQREPRDAVMAGVLVAAIFLFAAAYLILTGGG